MFNTIIKIKKKKTKHLGIFFNKFNLDIMVKLIKQLVVDAGLPNVFGKFSPGFQNFLEVFKSTHFWFYFQFKAKFKIRKVLISIKKLKRYCKVTFKCVF